MKNLYEVRFDTKKGYPKSWVVHVEADNREEAVRNVKTMWEKDSRLNDMHMFHISVRRLKDTEEFKYHYFAICGE